MTRPWAYVPVLAAAAALGLLSRALRVPAAALALAAGLLVGRAGFEVVSFEHLTNALPGVLVHVALLLGVLGYRLGQGMLRLPLTVVARRSLPPLGLAAASLAAGTVFLPFLLPEAAADRPFYRFALPLAFVFAVFPLLALRDLRGRPPSDAGSLFLVAVALVGAVYSFTPRLLWSHADPGLLWRGPVLVLGESGALGAGAAVLWLLLVRQLGVPRWVATAPAVVLVTWVSFWLSLWLPFAALGFGILLGRAGEAEWRVPRATGALFSEVPFVLLAGASFAPDLFREEAAVPALVNTLVLAALVLVVRQRLPGGRALVTGPGLLFLGLTLTVRLDERMGPINRYTVDFALPAWVALRVLMHRIGRRAPARRRDQAA